MDIVWAIILPVYLQVYWNILPHVFSSCFRFYVRVESRQLRPYDVEHFAALSTPVTPNSLHFSGSSLVCIKKPELMQINEMSTETLRAATIGHDQDDCSIIFHLTISRGPTFFRPDWVSSLCNSHC
jgi:hypothetical protein